MRPVTGGRRALVTSRRPVGLLGGHGALRLYERNLLVYRRSWMIIVSGFFEPLFFLFSIGVGIGELVGGVRVAGRSVDYAAFAAPALLAASAMNGAVYESTMNVFFKLRESKVYDAVLATPVGPRDVALGEIAWCVTRGALYATAFLVVMTALGLVQSWWGLLLLPGAVLIGSAFAAAGMSATTFMRGWEDFEFVQLVVLPLFLFSATFYPLATYPPAVQGVVRLTPLYQGVTLLRDLSLGTVGLSTAGHAAYLAVLTFAGLAVAGRRVERLLRR